MEFYAERLIWPFIKFSFNSQRDGILLEKVLLGGWVGIMVSIPNGMEFYEERAFLCSLVNVSIPNGMEFYPYPLIFSRAPNSFNSQRDGILRFDRFSRRRPLRRFNSQRDGILLMKILHLCKPRIVSIPNGMEFYGQLLYFLGALR